MKYIWRLFMVLLFCCRWLLLPILTISVNIFAVIWHFNKPSNGWFKLDKEDWYWLIGSPSDRTIEFYQGLPSYHYSNPWDMLINKKTKSEF